MSLLQHGCSYVAWFLVVLFWCCGDEVVSGCSNRAVFHTEKVVVCTVAKSASSLWRETLIHVEQERSPGPHRGTCNYVPHRGGCLLDQAPRDSRPTLFDPKTTAELVAKGYVFAHFMRDPIERVYSMFTGFGHAGGPKKGSITFDTFLDQLEHGKYRSNGAAEHTESVIHSCNKHIPRGVQPSWQFWTGPGPAGHGNATELQRRAHLFLHDLFGVETYKRVCHPNCTVNQDKPGYKSYSDSIFYQPRETAAAHNQNDAEAGTETSISSYTQRITQLYPEDMRAHAEALGREYPPANLPCPK